MTAFVEPVKPLNKTKNLKNVVKWDFLSSSKLDLV